MKIAIDIRKIGKKSTGSEVVFFYLVKHLAKLEGSKKHEFFLLTDDRVAKIRKIIEPLPQNFKICKVEPTNKLLWTFYSLPRFLKKNRIDLYHTEYIVPFYLRKKIKIVTTIHDISFKINPGWITKKDSLILNSLIPPSIKRADAIIAVSEFTKEEISGNYNYPKNKIGVTYPAVDTRYFFSINRDEAKKEAAKIVGGEFPFILHISSLQPRKNVPLIIEAFAKLKKSLLSSRVALRLPGMTNRSSDVKLVIVGSRNGYNYDKKIDEITAQYNLEDDVIITGYQPAEKLPYFYKTALAFVFPSAYEGFGIPLIESMASGTPVIASDIKVFREVADNAAIYVNIGKKDSAVKLAEKLKVLIENKKLREEKIKFGLERVKIFNWGKLAEKTLEIYERL